MSILANSETFFSHGRMGVLHEIFLKELNRIDEKKKKQKKERKKRKEKRRSRFDAKKECQFLSNIVLFVYFLGRGRIEFNQILC